MKRRSSKFAFILLAIILGIIVFLILNVWATLYLPVEAHAAEPSPEAWEASKRRIEAYKLEIKKARKEADLTFEELETGCKGSGNMQVCIEYQ